MTVDELTSLLEAVHLDAEVRIAVLGDPPMEFRIIAVAKSNKPGTLVAWLLTGAKGTPASVDIFDLQRRIGR